MLWCGIYLAVAGCAALATFLIANRSRPEGVSGPDHPAAISALAGMLWPVLILGVTEAALVSWFARFTVTH